MTYPWEIDPSTDDLELELEDGLAGEDEASSLEWETSHARRASGPPAWMRTVVPLLQRYAGTIPLPFLLGWIEKESGGRLADTTKLREYGYFQIMPSESQQLGFDHERIHVDADYSVRAGIKLVQYYAKLVRKRGVPPSAPSFWAWVKFHHAIGSGDAHKLLRAAAAHGVDLKSWSAVKAWAAANPALLSSMRRQPGRFFANVDGVLAAGQRLWALWQGAGHAAPAPSPSPPIWSPPPTSSASAWDGYGTAYVRWLQAGLNRALKLKHPLPVDGIPSHRVMEAVQRLQHGSKSKYVRMGIVGGWTEKLLVAAGAPPAPKDQPTTAGLDCNWDTKHIAACLPHVRHPTSKLPISFVVRYYSWSPGKNLSRSEADRLAAMGIRCAAVWEAHAKDANGVANGKLHARNAFKQARACGQPSGTPIYFAVDFEPSAAELAGVQHYFEGIRDELNAIQQDPKRNPTGLRYAIGVYGNRSGLDVCKRQGIATWFWQSCSKLTANGTNQFRWPGVNLQQDLCEKPVCASGCAGQKCASLKVDFNQSGGREGSWFPTPAAHAGAHEFEVLGFHERRRRRLGGLYAEEAPLDELFD